MTPVPVLVQVNSLALGGTQLNAVDLASELRQHGFDSLLVAPRDSLPTSGPSLFDVAAERDVRLLAIERPTTTLGGARELSRLAGEHRAQLVHTYGTWSIRPAFWGPCILGHRPFVMTVYEMQVHPSVYRANSLVIGTKYLEEELRDRPGPVRLISPPVDLSRDAPEAVDPSEFLREHDLAPDHTRIVIVSRLDDETLRPVKNTSVEVAIRTVESLATPQVDLVIVGTGNDEGRLRDIGLAANERLGRRAIVFTGALSDPRPAYECADIVIGMGGSAARGLAFAKPLVVSGEFGWFSTFGPATAGALFRNSFWSEEPAEDPLVVLRDQLEPLLADPIERANLGRFGREFAIRNFGLTAMAERLSQVYDEAIRSYRLRDWIYDLRLEREWARSWLGRRIGRDTPRPSELHRDVDAVPEFTRSRPEGS